MAAPAHPHSTVSDDKKLVKLLCVGSQNMIEASDFEGKARAGEPQEDHPDVWQSVTEDQFTEVTIVGDKNSAFTMGNREDLLVWKGNFIPPPCARWWLCGELELSAHSRQRRGRRRDKL